MPIYQGERLFLDGLDTVERVNLPFHKIVISFNGESSADYNLFCSERDRGRFNKDYTILRTHQEMSSLDHGVFISNHLNSFSINNLKIFFLAHDDRILNLFDDKGLLEFLENTKPDTIYFPSYSCCNAKDYLNVFEVIESDEILSSNDFFWITQKRNVPTSMSGMIVPLNAWIETLKVLLKAGSGARFEHLLCIANSINYVCFASNIRVLIAQRENSEADNLNALHHRVSSFYYVYTFFKNKRIKSFSEHILYSWILIKKIIGILTQYLVSVNYDTFLNYFKKYKIF